LRPLRNALDDAANRVDDNVWPFGREVGDVSTTVSGMWAIEAASCRCALRRAASSFSELLDLVTVHRQVFSLRG